MKSTIFLLLMCLCIESFGEVIIVRGRQFPLEYRNGLYYLPLSPGTTTIFITMDGVDKACFLDTAPPNTLEQISAVRIVSNGLPTKWNCFPYKTTIVADSPL